MEIDKPIRCAVMGQHPLRFPWGFDEEDDRCRKLKIELAQQIMVPVSYTHLTLPTIA